MTEYKYEIYERERCLYKNLEEKKFKSIWKLLKSLVGERTTPSIHELTWKRVKYIREIEERH